MNFLLKLIGGFGGQVYFYLALVLGGFGAGFYLEHLRFFNYQQEVKIAGEKQQLETAAKIKEQEIINDNVKQTYEARLTSINAFYSGLHNNGSSSLSASDPKATITINGETHNLLLVAEQCAITTSQLVSLQDWVNQQVNVSK